MSYKRSRAAFEADLQAQQSPYVFYGTPLPPLDPNVRDDGSFVPVWKQEVTDERGRKRLHGAFTGGFSAGYFNTVGSKEGWTPSTFVSSRLNRQKDAAVQQSPEDFMDDEDRAEAEESRQLATQDAYSGIGSTEDDVLRRAPLMDLLRPSGENMGVKLLRKMGWKDGQGIGAKVQRKARLDQDHETAEGVDGETHLFAPQNTRIITFERKNDTKGLGYHGEARLTETPSSSLRALKNSRSDDEEEVPLGPSDIRLKKKPSVRGTAFGVGVLNDDGSGDDDDPYSMGPRISYNKTLGGDKKNKKKTIANSERKLLTGNANPLLRTKPTFISKKTNRTENGFRRCHDGRLPLDGFVLSSKVYSSTLSQEVRHPPLPVPAGWKSSKLPVRGASFASETLNGSIAGRTTLDLVRTSALDPTSRASLLGEAQLPGRSVFEFITPAARDRLAALTKNNALPAGSALPSNSAVNTKASAVSSLESKIPFLDPNIAITALRRGVTGFVPYADDPEKLERYRVFLRYRASLGAGASAAAAPAPSISVSASSPEMPIPGPGAKTDDWLRELHEFAHAATIFRPMTGSMAERFTSGSSTATTKLRDEGNGDRDLEDDDKNRSSYVHTPAAKPKDPAEEAAAMGMFGPLTRSVAPWFPTRLLCKRFNVPAPAYVPAGSEAPSTATASGADAGFSSAPATGASFTATAPGASRGGASGSAGAATGSRSQSSGFLEATPSINNIANNTTTSTGNGAAPRKSKELVGARDMEALMRDAGIEDPAAALEEHRQQTEVDLERNAALEQERPADAVFRAIFGSDSEDDD